MHLTSQHRASSLAGPRTGVPTGQVSARLAARPHSGAAVVARAAAEASLADASLAAAAPAPPAAAAPAAPITSSLPSAPDLKLPDVKLPDVKLPDVKLPDVQLPDVSAAAAGVSDKAAELAAAASKATSSVTGGVSDIAGKAAAGLNSATSGVAGTLSGIGSGVSSGVAGIKNSLGAGASSITDQVGSVAGQVGGTVSSTLSGLKASVDQATSGVSGVVGSTVDQLSASTKAASDAVAGVVDGSTAAVQQALDTLNAQATAVSGSVAAAVDGTTQQVLDTLPPPVKDAAVAVGGVVGAVAGQAIEHPQAAAVVAVAVGGPAAYNAYKRRYGGYAGEVGPLQVADLLSTDDNVFLVDIRSEQQREQEGLPELKLGARFKVAAFPVQVTVPPRVARESGNADELKLLVNAAYIAGLPQCKGPLTKLFIMDSSGSDKARDLARALTSLGQPLSYVLTDGFKGWAAADLPVLEDAVEYDSSTGAVLGDELEVIAQRANEAVTTVTQPQVGLPLLGGSALAVYAALNIHTALQYIGVLGVLLTLANKALSYDSPAAALDDAKAAAGSASRVLSKLGSIKPPALPKAPALPSLPTSFSGGNQQPASAAARGSSGSGSGGAAGTAAAAAAVAGVGARSSGGGSGGEGADAADEAGE